MVFFNHKYPLRDNAFLLLGLALKIGFFVSLFLIFFKPFGFCAPGLAPVAIGYGLIAFLITFLIPFLLPKLIPNLFRPMDWTIGKELIIALLILICISLANFYYYQYFVEIYYEPNGLHTNSFNLFELVWQTFSIGIIPITFMIFINQNMLFNARRVDAYQINDALKVFKKNESIGTIEIVGSGKNEFLSIDKNNFICVIVKFHKVVDVS